MADHTSDVYKTFDLALRVGEVLLSSGAGAADVAVQMSNVGVACGLRRVSANVTFTELSISHQEGPDDVPLMQMREVRHREIDYADLTAVDHLVRRLVEGEIERDEARADLNKIVSTGHVRPRWMVTLGFGALGGGVGLMLGGRPILVAIAFLAALGTDLIQHQMTRTRLPSFYAQVVGGLFATLLAVGVAATDLDVGTSRVVTASIILLLAGVNFFGAMQDALDGFPVTANARILEALLSTGGIVAGVSGGLTISRLVGQPIELLHPGASAFSPLPVMTLGGAISSAAFAFSSYTPTRALLPIGVAGGAATLVFGAGIQFHLGGPWSSGLAAFVVGLVAYFLASRVRVPALTVVVSGTVPLLPGLSIYRGLSQLLRAHGAAPGLVGLINAAAIAIAISAGVILGEYFGQPTGREAQKFERRLAGPRLVGPRNVAKKTRRAARRAARLRSQGDQDASGSDYREDRGIRAADATRVRDGRVRDGSRRTSAAREAGRRTSRRG